MSCKIKKQSNINDRIPNNLLKKKTFRFGQIWIAKFKSNNHAPNNFEKNG